MNLGYGIFEKGMSFALLMNEFLRSRIRDGFEKSSRSPAAKHAGQERLQAPKE
jgi:hypothetical protein